MRRLRALRPRNAMRKSRKLKSKGCTQKERSSMPRSSDWKQTKPPVRLKPMRWPPRLMERSSFFWSYLLESVRSLLSRGGGSDRQANFLQSHQRQRKYPFLSLPTLPK